MVQSGLGKLFAVDAASGGSREIALDTPVTNGDGLLLRGRTLFVVQNRDNKVAVVKLGRGLKRGKVTGYLRSPHFDVPTTLAPFKQFVYAVNARFDRPDDSDADVVRLSPAPAAATWIRPAGRSGSTGSRCARGPWLRRSASTR